MVRKCICILALLGLLACCLPCHSVRAAAVYPSLQFSGTTAICKGTVSGSGSISANLELWQGSTKLISWPGSGNGFVQISETYTVVSGVTYTLKLNGTINGVSFPEASVTKTCP